MAGNIRNWDDPNWRPSCPVCGTLMKCSDRQSMEFECDCDHSYFWPAASYYECKGT